MSNFRSTRYARLKQARRREGIAAYYRHKADAARIPENENVLRTRVSADVVVTIKFKGQPQMQFSTYRTPWGGWTISPTLAGQKVQQMMLHATT
jgi:hypothetical protein